MLSEIMDRQYKETDNGKGCMCCTRSALGGLLVLIVAMTLAGMTYQSIATARELRQFSPLGQMVSVHGHEMHITCTGEGSPTVIMEAGDGAWSVHWQLVQPEVARFTRACSYDRAGYGWSDPGPKPRTAKQIVGELHTLLTNAGIEGPYVLVGHSLGGIYARLYADQYPDEVVGVVLVDASHEDLRLKRPPGYRAVQAQTNWMLRALWVMSRLGLLRSMRPLTGQDTDAVPAMPCTPFAVRYLPAEMHPMYLAVESQPKCFAATLGEREALGESDAQVRAAGPLGDMPLVVLTHGITGPIPEGKPAGLAEEEERTWQELQEDLANLSSDSTLIVAEQSGHHIPLEQPVLVIDAIHQVVEDARALKIPGW